MGDKIRVVLGTVFPLDEAYVQGGVEAVALYLSRALGKRKDIELHIVSCNRSVTNDYVEGRGAVTIHWLAGRQRLYSLRALTLDAWRVRRALAIIKPDVVHAQGFSEYATGATSQKPLVLAIHGMEMLVPWMRRTAHFRGASGIYRLLAGKLIAETSIRNARVVISNAGNYVTEVLGPQLQGKKIYSIFNPVSDNFFEIPAVRASDDRTVLWVGLISERKNIIALVEAFGLVRRWMPGVRLRLVGAVAEPSYLAHVRMRIVQLGLSKCVEVTGTVDQASLLRAYESASILALTSLEETAPMAVAQALAAGKPVVSTNVGGVRWMIEDGVTGYVVSPNDTQALADRIISLLSDDEGRQAMGTAARARAHDKFSADAVADQTVEAYLSQTGTACERRRDV